MTSGNNHQTTNTSDDHTKARQHLDQAAASLAETNRVELDEWPCLEAHLEAQTAALIGTGYAHLASLRYIEQRDTELLERSDRQRAEDVALAKATAALAERQLAVIAQDDPTLTAALRRAAQAEDEARPGDERVKWMRLGAENALNWAAEFAGEADKTRSAAWLKVCAAEPDPAKWPPAPTGPEQAVKSEFAVGDRVQARADMSFHGRVVAVHPDADPTVGESRYGVRWDGHASVDGEDERDLMAEESPAETREAH